MRRNSGERSLPAYRGPGPLRANPLRRWGEGGADGFAAFSSRARCSIVRANSSHGGNHEDVWQNSPRHCWRWPLISGFRRRAKQGHDRGRRRRLPVLSADRAGQAARRISTRRALAVELVDLKGGSDALKAVLGGSADVVSGYFDHCVNLAAKKQELQSFVVYDRYPGRVLVVSPAHTSEIKSIKDLAGKKVGVSAPGSSTDFFLKFLLKKNGIDPASVAVIGVGLGATAVAAMEQGQIDAAVMLDPSVTVLQGRPSRPAHPLRYPHGRRIRSTCSAANIRAARSTRPRRGSPAHEKEAQALTNAILSHADLDPRAFGRRDHGRKCPPKWSARTRSCILPR